LLWGGGGDDAQPGKKGGSRKGAAKRKGELIAGNSKSPGKKRVIDRVGNAIRVGDQGKFGVGPIEGRNKDDQSLRKRKSLRSKTGGKKRKTITALLVWEWVKYSSIP